MDCKECGEHLPDLARYCPHCGYPVPQTSENNDETLGEFLLSSIIMSVVLGTIVYFIGIILTGSPHDAEAWFYFVLLCLSVAFVFGFRPSKFKRKNKRN